MSQPELEPQVSSVIRIPSWVRDVLMEDANANDTSLSDEISSQLSEALADRKPDPEQEPLSAPAPEDDVQVDEQELAEALVDRKRVEEVTRKAYLASGKKDPGEIPLITERRETEGAPAGMCAHNRSLALPCPECESAAVV